MDTVQIPEDVAALGAAEVADYVAYRALRAAGEMLLENEEG